jgi:hypothetical protein
MFCEKLRRGACRRMYIPMASMLISQTPSSSDSYTPFPSATYMPTWPSATYMPTWPPSASYMPHSYTSATYMPTWPSPSLSSSPSVSGSPSASVTVGHYTGPYPSYSAPPKSPAPPIAPTSTKPVLTEEGLIGILCAFSLVMLYSISFNIYYCRRQAIEKARRKVLQNANHQLVASPLSVIR